MDLLRTAMVDIAMRIAACHALKSAPVRGERATRCSRRVRLHRELKRGTVAYLDVLCRARLGRVDDDLLARCRVAAEQQMPLALAHRRSLQRMRDGQSGVPAGLLCAANVAPPWLVHTTGTLAKLFSEAVEAIDPRPVDGIRATGAPTLVEVLYGVVPQVLPLWLSFTLYRFESKRSAAVVGMVGAGGIGVVLHEVIRGFQYAQTAAVLVILVVTVTLIDLLSAWLRNRYI